MGNALSRPSCLGRRHAPSQDALQPPCSTVAATAAAWLPDKVLPNGCGATPLRRCDGSESPPPQPTVHASGASPRRSVAWRRARELTEVTEVTETVVTEIVEVTQYPALPSARSAACDAPRRMPEEPPCAGAAALQVWLGEMEQLVRNQKAPAADAKVATAQLQEQKLLQRLLEERRPHVELLLLQDEAAAEHNCDAAAPDGGDGGDCSLAARWAKLLQEAEDRAEQLQRILPAAQALEDALGSLQQWVAAAEMQLTQLGSGGGGGCMQDAHRQSQALSEEVQQRLPELEATLQQAQELQQLVSGEEAQLLQEKLEALRTRYLLLRRGCGDAELRLQEALEAATHPGAAQDELWRWIGRAEAAAATQEMRRGEWEELERLLQSQLQSVAELEERLEEQRPMQLEAQALQSQLADLQLLMAEVSQRRGRLQRFQAATEPLLRSCDDDALRLRLQASSHSLRDGAERLWEGAVAAWWQRQRAAALLSQFAEAQEELQPWLRRAQELQPQAAPDDLRPQALRQQLQRLQELREAVAEHRPLLAKLQRVSSQLSQLSAPAQAAPFLQRCGEAEEQFGRIRERLHRAAALLQDVLPRYGQLTERMEALRERLERLQERLQREPSDAALLQEQLRENDAAQGELEALREALQALQAQGEELLPGMRAAGAEAAAEGLQEELRALQERWAGRALRLQELQAVAQRVAAAQEEAAQAMADARAMLQRCSGGDDDQEPEALRAQLGEVQALQEELRALRREGEALNAMEQQLQPQQSRSVQELLGALGALEAQCGECVARLEQRLRNSLDTERQLQELQRWLAVAEPRVAADVAVGGGDAAQLQLQLHRLQELRRELQQCRMQAESLRPPGGLSAFRTRCDRMEEELLQRQHRLEASLLGLGRVQHHLEELLQWLQQAALQLHGPAPLRPDLQGCEIELAKHKVLHNDVLSHARSVQSVLEAGRELQRCSGDGSDGDEGLRQRLQELSERWAALRSAADSRQLQLQNHLSQVQDATLEMTELLQWLEEGELQLFFAQPPGKLSAHLPHPLPQELCREMESKEPSFRALQQRLQRLLDSCSSSSCSSSSSTEHALRLLQRKWDSVHAELQRRKERLAQGVTAAAELHAALQELQRWLQEAEEQLAAPAPPGSALHTIDAQLQQHKALLQEAMAQAEALSGLQAAAVQLQGLSRGGGGGGGAAVQKMLRTARERLQKVQRRAGERSAALEELQKCSKQFLESQQLLQEWMQEVERSLAAAPPDAATTQEELKRQLAEQKALQKLLRRKRPSLEAALRCGRALRQRTQSPEEALGLQMQLQRLQQRWDTMEGGAAERLRRLEERLLLSGRVAEALQALHEWLDGAEPQLSDDAALGGDCDRVAELIHKHKVLQKELGERAGCMRMLKRSLRELTGGSCSADAQWLQRQMEELSARWDRVCSLSVCRQARLQEALRQAEEFRSLSQSFLQRLDDAERALQLSACNDDDDEDEAALQERQNALQELQQSLQCQQLELECIASLGDAILSASHPDAAVAVRSCVDAADGRFREVQRWSQQEAERLRARAAAHAAEREELSQLLDWIAAAEEALELRQREALPQELQELQELSAQHAVFVEELNRKEPEVQRFTKSCKRRTAAELPTTPTRRPGTRRRSSTGKAQGAASQPPEGSEPPATTTQAAQLLHRWQQLWLTALDRQYRLETALQHLREVEEFSRFEVAQWRRRFLQWMAQSKARALDVFRTIDRNHHGRVALRHFSDALLASTFPTTALEAAAVARSFDLNGDGFIDYCEFVSALHPNRDALRRCADADSIQDEVRRQVSQCSCAKRFHVEQISANRYRFGESQQLRMVRLLRSALMVRVGGGWIALDEFLVKNDPCRVKGRTNLKINEKYWGGDGCAAAAKCSANASPQRSRSNSSLSLCSSSASAPCSPAARKSVLRRTRSGDRCCHSRSSLLHRGADLQLPAAPAEPPDASPPLQRRSSSPSAASSASLQPHSLQSSGQPSPPPSSPHAATAAAAASTASAPQPPAEPDASCSRS